MAHDGNSSESIVAGALGLKATWIYTIIIIIIKGIYIAQVRKGHKCAMSAGMAVWLRSLTVYVSIAIYITNCQDS